MARSKYYAVRKGRQPGIYTHWEECSAQVSGFPGAVYKGFDTLREAKAFLGGETPAASQPALLELEPPGAPAPAAHAPDESRTVILYTDGGCINNPGPGGYGAVLRHGGRRKELSGGFRLTTNNRMELTACIAGLEALKDDAAVTVFSDSRYLVNGMNSGAALRWRRGRWQRKGGNVPNADLWIRLLDLCDRRPVTFEWVRGHAGNPENERCDQLAMAAARRPNLPPDPGYESGQKE